MSSWNLPTCNRCQRRKKKCDKSLPRCANCKEAGIECIFFDKGTQGDVSRRTIQELEGKAQLLEAELESLHSTGSPGTNPAQPNPPSLQSPMSLDHGRLPGDNLWNSLGQYSLVQYTDTASPDPFFTPNFMGSDGMLDLCISAAESARLDSLELDLPKEPFSAPFPYPATDPSRSDRFDRAAIEPSLIRSLIDEYFFRILQPQYPVVEHSQVEFDTEMKQLPSRKRLFVTLTAAIAAAHLGLRDRSMQQTAHVLRSWADDLASDLLSQQDDDALQALILLTFYELVDPRRKIICSLLGFTCRMCIRLRWYREQESVLTPADHDMASHVVRYPATWRWRLFCIVYEWERSICLALQRPSVLSIDLADLSSASNVRARTLYTELALRHKSRECSDDNCLIQCNFASFVAEKLNKSDSCDILWISVYCIAQLSSWPRVSAHEQYTAAWTGPILAAAMSRIRGVFAAQRKGCVVSVWMSALDVFTAGLVLVDIFCREPGAITETGLHQEWTGALRRASSLLAGFAEIWEGAQAHRDILDAMLDRIFASLR